jgi:bacillithiol biosynthesis cysteine-adding enzyme BshC
MELIVSRPSGARVVQDYLAGEAAAADFFGRRFDDLASFAAKAAEVDGRFDRAARERAVAALTVPPGADPSRLRRFVDEGGYVVTTGQQPGLYGGPLYSIYKALTAVRLAEALEERLGKPVLPVFWVASDDHDWVEANHADVITVDNELRRFQIDTPDPGRAPALHRIELPAQADEVLDAFCAVLPDTEFSGEFVSLIRDGYRSGRTLPDGFHALMQGALGRFGLYFTDAADPTVKEGSRELLLGELEDSARFEDVLRATAHQLELQGYDLQVPILEGGVNLFLEGSAGRERLYREEGRFRLRGSGEYLDVVEIRARVERDPLALSPNVLLRPVVESRVFPTLAYVGGPGEMAYFAQLRGYFEAHGIEMPIVFPRWAATVVETKIRKVLDKFGMALPGLSRPFHEIASEIAREEVPADVRAAIGQLRGALGTGVSELQRAASAVDPTLKGPVQHLRSQAFGALDDVEKKVTAAVKREREITLSQLEKAQLHLYPLGSPAERVQSPMYFLTRYGGTFLDRLFTAFAVEFER